MAILAGNLLTRTAMEIQCRAIFIPWVKKKSVILCSNVRDYSSSFPVRYIPKTSSKPEESQASSPLSRKEHNISDPNVLRAKFSNGRKSPKKSSKSGELQASSPLHGLEDRKDHNVSDLHVLRVEPSNGGKSPKKSSKTEELQASSPLNGLEDGKEHYILESNVLRAEFSNVGKSPKKSSIPLELQASFPLNGLEEGKEHNISNLNVSRAEFTNGEKSPKKSSKTEELQTFSHLDGLWDRKEHNLLDPNVLRAEFSNGGKSPNKSLKTGVSQASTPLSGLKGRKECNISELNLLRAEFSNGGKSLWRNFKCQNQNQRPVKNLAFDVKQEVEEELDHVESGDYEFIEESEEIVQELEISQGKHPDGLLEIRDVKTKDVEKMAVELLATRAFTAVALRKKLCGKKFPLDIVDAVITDFQSRGLINDCLYAETFSRSRWSSSSWGPRRIKQALFKKGVSSVVAEKAIKLVFKDGEADDQESRLGMSKLSMDRLFVQALKQWQRGCDVSKETRKSRIVRWLQYRGFNWSVIGYVVKKLESEPPP